MAETPGNARKILLIVEDDSVLSKDLASFFRDAGFFVLQAQDGVTGLQTAVKEKPDVILLDIVLPKMNGLTVLQKLKQEHKDLHIPVILLTNLEADNAIIKTITESEPSYYLIKNDTHLQGILEKVNSTLESPRE